MTERSGTIAARVLWRLVDRVVARGHDADALCRSVGLSLAVMRDAEARVPYAAAEQLGERAVALTGDDNFGLHLAQDVRDTQVYDAGVLMLMASPSVRAGLERMARYQRYWGDGERVRLVPAVGGTCVRYAYPGAAERPWRHGDECALAEVVLGVRVLSAQAVGPRAVRFRHAAPADVTEHEALFGCPLEFEAEHAEAEFDDEALDAPMRHANEAYATIFEQQVERALTRLPGASGTVVAVRAAARAALGGGGCTLAGTARMLGMSARTMQRRLHVEGTSFGELVDALRREMADELLDRKLSVPEISWLLGYADASAFHHAFKRWTGTSPEQARAARGASPPTG